MNTQPRDAQNNPDSLTGSVVQAARQLGSLTQKGWEATQRANTVLQRSIEQAARESGSGRLTIDVAQENARLMLHTQALIDEARDRRNSQLRPVLSLQTTGTQSFPSVLGDTAKALLDLASKRLDFGRDQRAWTREIRRADQKQSKLLKEQIRLNEKVQQNPDALELRTSERLAAVPAAFRTLLREAVDSTAKTVRHLFSSSADAVRAKSDAVVTAASDALSDLVQAGSDRATHVGNRISTRFSAVLHKAVAFTHTVKTALDDTAKTVRHLFSSSADSVRAKSDAAMTTASDALSQTLHSGSDRATDVANRVETRFSAVLHKAVEFTQAVKGGLQSTVDEAMAERTLKQLHEVSHSPMRALDFKTVLNQLQTSDPLALGKAKRDVVDFAREHPGDLSLTNAARLSLSLAKVCARDDDVHTLEAVAAQWQANPRLGRVVDSLHSASENILSAKAERSAEPVTSFSSAQPAPAVDPFAISSQRASPLSSLAGLSPHPDLSMP